MKKNMMPHGLTTLLVGALLSLSFSLSAQGAPPDAPRRGERIKALRAAFITQQLDLSEKEAQAFWPVFNEYQEKIKAINDGTQKQLKKGLENLSDAELEKLLDQELANEEKILALKKEYLTKFKSVLPVRKVARLSLVEKQFRMEVLKRAKEGPRGDGRGPGKAPGGHGAGRRN